MEFDDMELEESSTQSGMKKFGRILAIGIVLVVAGFGDVMYIQLMQSHFPDGLLLALCYVGAFTSLLAIGYMLIGKSVLFTPGLQMIIAWPIFLAELVLIALNIILVFQNDGSGATGFLGVWWQLAPATPVIHMAGVAVLFFLDEDNKMHHEDVELAWDMKRAKRRFFKATAKARLRLQNKQLNFLVTEMDRAVASPESMQAIQQTAIEMNQYLLGQLSGGRTYRVPALPSGATVDANPPTTPAPTNPPPAPTPEPPKRSILSKLFSGNQQPTPAEPPVAPVSQSPAIDMEAMFKAFQSWQAQQTHTDVQISPQKAAPGPAQPKEVEYTVNHRPSPTTDQLVPFPKAPSQNGASQNGHNHLSPMVE